MTAALCSVALFTLLQADAAPRRIFPVQAHAAAAFGAGSSFIARGELSLLAAFGAVHGDGGRFFAIGVTGQVEQPDLGRCARTCGRGGAGPQLRYGYARVSQATGPPDWHAGVDLSVIYSDQFIGVPLARFDAVSVRLAGTVTAAGISRRLFSNPKAVNLTSWLLPLAVLNHGGVFAEAGRYWPGLYRVHFGLQLGSGF